MSKVAGGGTPRKPCRSRLPGLRMVGPFCLKCATDLPRALVARSNAHFGFGKTDLVNSRPYQVSDVSGSLARSLVAQGVRPESRSHLAARRSLGTTVKKTSAFESPSRGSPSSRSDPPWL